MEISTLLPGVWLVDVERPTNSSPLRFRFRFVRMAIVNFIGRNHNGLWLGDLYADCHLSPEYEALAGALLRHTISCLHHRPIARPNKRYIGVERVYMPLTANGANVDTVFGINVYTPLS